MYRLNHAISIMITAFFIFRSLQIFSKIYKYEKNNGYIGKTICFMTSPKGFTLDWAKKFVRYSKWVVGAFSMGLCIHVFIELIQQSTGFAMLYSFGMYLMCTGWLIAYNHFSGVKIGEMGLVIGVDLVKWSNIEAYSFGSIHKRNHPFIRMTIKELGSIKPLNVYVNTENTTFIMSLVKEYLVQ